MEIKIKKTIEETLTLTAPVFFQQTNGFTESAEYAAVLKDGVVLRIFQSGCDRYTNIRLSSIEDEKANVTNWLESFEPMEEPDFIVAWQAALKRLPWLPGETCSS